MRVVVVTDPYSFELGRRLVQEDVIERDVAAARRSPELAGEGEHLLVDGHVKAPHHPLLDERRFPLQLIQRHLPLLNLVGEVPGGFAFFGGDFFRGGSAVGGAILVRLVADDEPLLVGRALATERRAPVHRSAVGEVQAVVVGEGTIDERGVGRVLQVFRVEVGRDVPPAKPPAAAIWNQPSLQRPPFARAPRGDALPFPERAEANDFFLLVGGAVGRAEGSRGG